MLPLLYDLEMMLRPRWLAIVWLLVSSCRFDTSARYRASDGSPDASIAPVCDNTLTELVACFEFEDGTGAATLADSSMYGNNAIVSNALFVTEGIRILGHSRNQPERKGFLAGCRGDVVGPLPCRWQPRIPAAKCLPEFIV